MNPTDESAPTIPTREQLLAALDSEISGAQATMSATGRTHWALTLSLSGLLWLGITTWGEGKFSGQKVALLAVALSAIWEVALQVRSALDSSLLPPQSARGKFFSFSRLLGALRSTIFFMAIKHVIALAVLVWLEAPELWLLKYCSAANLIAVMLVLVFSYFETPPISPTAVQRRFPAMLVASSVLVWVIRIAVIVSVGMVLWKSRSAFEANDFRLGLIAAALAYLLTVLVEEQFSANHLAALRTVRQNLAFSRITPEDACNQTDLLLFTGGSATQSVQHQLDGILTMADQIRSNYAQIESLLPNYNYLVSEIARPKFEGELLLTKAEESDKLRDFLLRLFTQAQEQHEALHKRTKKLEGHIKAIAFFSPSAAKETEPLTEKVKVALAPLSEQRKKIQRALLPAAFAAGANLR